MRVYIETTIPSYLTSWPSPMVVHAGHQISTREWWNNHRDRYDLYTSLVTLQEAGSGDADAARRRLDALDGIPMLALTSECEAIARAILGSGLMPANADRDALHVGIATFHGMDVLLTWAHRERKYPTRIACAHRFPGVCSAHNRHPGRTAAAIAMIKESTNDVLAEVWEAKDTLSAKHGHDLGSTCRALYAEQEMNPGQFVNLGQTKRAQQGAADQPATRSASNASG